jgi:hypothetical protein
MKKSKFFMAAGAVVLTITAVFATKVNKRFNNVITAFAGSGGAKLVLPASSDQYLTTNNTGGRAYLEIYTTGGTNYKFTDALITESGHAVFYK